jgi:hypothetical protein
LRQASAVAAMKAQLDGSASTAKTALLLEIDVVES